WTVDRRPLTVNRERSVTCWSTGSLNARGLRNGNRREIGASPRRARPRLIRCDRRPRSRRTTCHGQTSSPSLRVHPAAGGPRRWRRLLPPPHVEPDALGRALRELLHDSQDALILPPDRRGDDQQTTEGAGVLETEVERYESAERRAT